MITTSSTTNGVTTAATNNSPVRPIPVPTNAPPLNLTGLTNYFIGGFTNIVSGIDASNLVFTNIFFTNIFFQFPSTVSQPKWFLPRARALGRLVGRFDV